MSRTEKPNRLTHLRPVLSQLLLATVFAACGSAVADDHAPARLADTGLFADAATGVIAAAAIPFEPQYPLWTDGAQKRRWIALPAGSAIDASDVDHWQFPIGTRLWKEFTFAGGKETRFMRRCRDGSWLYATYVQRDGESEAALAPEAGVVAFTPTANGKHHDVPSRADCRLCHEGGRTPVLGFSALQLSSHRDPLAPNAMPAPRDGLDLATLVDRDLVRGLPAAFAATPPRIAGRTPNERATLGYLHGNCGNCHNADGPLQRLGLRLDYPLARGGTAPALASTVSVPSAFVRGNAHTRVVPGAPADSVLFLRLAADDAMTQMPPFGRHLVDAAAKTLVERWIRTDLSATDTQYQFPHHLANRREGQ